MPGKRLRNCGSRGKSQSAASALVEVIRNGSAVSPLTSSPLSRYLRDVQAATRHIAVAPHMYALAGRIRLGMEPGLARF